MRRIFGPRRNKVTGELRKLQNGEFSALYCLPNIIRTIESEVRLAGNVAQILRREVHTGFWCGNLRERDHLEELGVDRSQILRLDQEVGDGDMDWIVLAQDRDRWRAVVNAVMILRLL
jgi:uncharacterized SAM-binding protein YcdF (DUF218 family)